MPAPEPVRARAGVRGLEPPPQLRRPGEAGPELEPAFADIAVPLRLRAGERELAFLSTATTFGTAVDVTVAELSIQSFFPADAETAAAMRALV